MAERTGFEEFLAQSAGSQPEPQTRTQATGFQQFLSENGASSSPYANIEFDVEQMQREDPRNPQRAREALHRQYGVERVDELPLQQRNAFMRYLHDQNIVGQGVNDAIGATPLTADQIEREYNRAVGRRIVEDGGGMGQVAGGLSSFQRGQSLGWGDELTGLGNAVWKGVESAAHLQNPIEGARRGYIEGAERSRGAQEAFAEQRPMVSAGLEIGGGVATVGPRMGSASGSLLSRTGRGALEGAALGGAYGVGVGDNGNRIESGVTNAMFGAAGGAVMPAAGDILRRTTRPAGNVMASMVDGIPGVSGTRQARDQAVADAYIARTARNSGMTPDEMWQRADSFADRPAVLADVTGQDSINMLTSLTRRPGTTAQAAQGLVEERFGEFTDRALRDIERATGVNVDNVQGQVDDMIRQRQQAAAPVYDELYQNFPSLGSERLDGLIENSPALRGFATQAEASMRNRAAMRGVEPESISRMEYVDAIKQLIDEALQDAQTRQVQSVRIDGVSAPVRELMQLRGALVREADNLTDGAYAAARDVGGEAPSLRESVRHGERAMRQRVNPRELSRQVAETNEQDVPFMRQGAAAALSDQIVDGKKPQSFRTRGAQQRVRTVFGDDAGQEILDSMSAEAELLDLAARYGPRNNSVTGIVSHNGPSEVGDEIVRGAANLATGNKIGLVSQIESWMRRSGFSQAQKDEIGRLLLSDPAEGLRRLGITRGGSGVPTTSANPVNGGRSIPGYISPTPALVAPTLSPDNVLDQ